MSIDPKQFQTKPRYISKQVEDPAPIAGQAMLFPKEVDSVTEWFSQDSEGNVTQITTKGSLNLPQIPSLVPSGGGMDTFLTKASGDDYATNWRKIHSLMNEFYFMLPSAPTLANRISALGSVSGLTLNTAENDPNADDDFGSSPNTLILTPAGLSGVVMCEVSIMELTTTGTPESQGWNKFATIFNHKSNKAMTKGGIVDLGTLLDTSKDILVKVRFIKTTMP